MALYLILGSVLVPPPTSAHAQAPSAERNEEVRICAGGDVMLGNNLPHARMPSADPDALLSPLRPLFADADVVLVNVEAAIGEGPAPSKCGPESTACYAFRQPVETAAALRKLADRAEVVGNVANNHSRDAGDPGIEATLHHLSDAGVHVTGTDSLPTVVVTERGDTVAVLGFSTFSVGLDARDLDAVRRHVGRAASRYARVVVSVHMGAEGRGAQRTRDTTEIFLETLDRGNPVAFARTATEAGADLVIGHGPHVMRAIEWHNDALILYSLGNLVTYGPFSIAEPLNRGAVVCVSLDGTGWITEARLYPTRQRRPGRVGRDPAARAIVLVDSLSRLDFPLSRTRVTPDGELRSLWVPPEVVGAPEPRIQLRLPR